MERLSFDDLKYLVTLLKVDYSLLLDRYDSDGDVTPVVNIMSNCEYNKLHTFMSLLQQLYSYRPLLF